MLACTYSNYITDANYAALCGENVQTQMKHRHRTVVSRPPGEGTRAAQTEPFALNIDVNTPRREL